MLSLTKICYTGSNSGTGADEGVGEILPQMVISEEIYFSRLVILEFRVKINTCQKVQYGFFHSVYRTQTHHTSIGPQIG